MRISAKARYGLAAMINLSRCDHTGENISAISIAEDLKISKIYLEQVFASLKRAGLLVSVKGAQGGYRLAKSPDKISAYDILHAVDSALFEKTEVTVPLQAPDIEKAMFSGVFEPVQNVIKEVLEEVSLADLVRKADSYSDPSALMYYI